MINTLRPGQAERIAHLFRRGYSLDLVAELGLLYDWTRNQAKVVVAEQGWALDYSGRLQVSYLKAEKPTWPSVATADPERLLNAGIDHESADVRKAALAAEKAIEKLRSVMLCQEQIDAELAAMNKRGKAAEVASTRLHSLLGNIPAPRVTQDSVGVF